MKRSFIYLITSCTLLASCHSNEKKAPQTDIEIATAFIRDVLDNKLEDANQFILKDESNQQYFEIIKEQYRKKDRVELEKYKTADILINEVNNVTDTVSIVNYSNTYNKELKNKVKVVRINGKWLIDLKYTFSGNM